MQEAFAAFTTRALALCLLAGEGGTEVGISRRRTNDDSPRISRVSEICLRTYCQGLFLASVDGQFGSIFIAS